MLDVSGIRANPLATINTEGEREEEREGEREGDLSVDKTK